MIPKGNLRGSWDERAACKGKNMILRSTSKNIAWYMRRPTDAERILLCTRCPVLPQCTDWVMSEDVDPCPFHIVAGMVPTERGRLRKQARRAS